MKTKRAAVGNSEQSAYSFTFDPGTDDVPKKHFAKRAGRNKNKVTRLRKTVEADRSDKSGKNTKKQTDSKRSKITNKHVDNGHNMGALSFQKVPQKATESVSPNYSPIQPNQLSFQGSENCPFYLTSDDDNDDDDYV